MKVYELKLIEGGKGAFKISVVKDPAVESTLLKFSEEKAEIMTFNDEEKRIIYSVAMRPNKLIPRNNVNGEPAKVFYTKDTVEKMQINYFRNNGNLTTNINHSENVNATGIFPFESWVVENPEIDKSKMIGLDTKIGDWVMAYKVDNVELWNDYIKTDKLDGLSIEATNMEHIFKNDIKMSEQKKVTFFQKMKEVFNEFAAEEEEVVEDVKPEEEEIKAAEEEPKKEEVIEAAEEEVVEPTDEVKALQDEIISLKQTIAELEADKVKEETELETMKSEIVEMKKQLPSAEKIVNAPKKVYFSKEDADNYQNLSELDKRKWQRANK